MPYTPTNLYPRNCAIEQSNEYSFLGTIDKHDEIDAVDLMFYEKNSKGQISEHTAFHIDSTGVVGQKEIAKGDTEWQENNLIQLNENSTLPVYNYSNDTINLIVSSLELESEDYENVKIISITQDWVPLNKRELNSRVTITEGAFSLNITLEFDNNSSLHETIHIIIPCKSSLDYRVNEEGIQFDKGYLPNVAITSDNKIIEFISFQGNGSGTIKLGDNSYHINSDSLTNLSWIGRNICFTGHLVVEYIIPNITLFFKENIAIKLNNIKFQLTSEGPGTTIYSNYAPVWWFVTTTEENLELCGFYEYSFDDGDWRNLIYFLGGSRYYYYSYNIPGEAYVITNKDGTKEYYKDEVLSYDSINYYRPSSFSEYLQNKDIYWTYKLYGKNKDMFIIDGLGTFTPTENYMTIPSNEQLIDGQLLNDRYYIKIHNNTYYYFKQGIASLNIINSDTVYSHTLTFSNNELKEIEKGIHNSQTNLKFSVGTTEITSYTIDSTSNTITFSLDYSLLGDITSSSIVYSFERNEAQIKLYKDELMTTEIDYSSIPEELYITVMGNTIESSIQNFSILEPLTLVESFIKIYNKDLSVEYNYSGNLSWFKYEIYENDILVFKSDKKFDPIVKIDYNYIVPNAKYVVNITVGDAQKTAKTFSFNYIGSSYEYEQVNFISYNSNKRAMQINLGNYIDLPWFDVSTQTYWYFENNKWVQHTTLFDVDNQVLLGLFATIYQYELKDNQIVSSQQVVKNISLEPKWVNNEYNFTHLLYHYNIKPDCTYMYEVFYSGIVLNYIKVFEILSTDGTLIPKIYYNNNFYLLNADQWILEKIDNTHYRLNTTDKSITFESDESGNIISALDQNNISLTINQLDDIQQQSKENFSIVRSTPRQTDDWLGVCLYGTKYDGILEEQNIYQLDPNQIWFFDLDTQADTIDYINERNIFANASILPKVGISNMNYMSQSITTKLGYLNEDDIYVEDNGEKLNQFSKWANDGTVKILRLRNGYLIPVDIQLTNQTANYKLVGEPSDISFKWVQIGDHETSVLYEIEN